MAPHTKTSTINSPVCNPFSLGGHRHDPAAPADPDMDHPAEVGGGGRQGPHPVHLVAFGAGRGRHRIHPVEVCPARSVP